MLRVYSTGDGPDVYEDQFLKIAKPEGQEFHPTLILVGTRLGIDKITPVYWEALIASLQMPQSVGIAGYVSSSHNRACLSLTITQPVAALLHPTTSSEPKDLSSST